MRYVLMLFLIGTGLGQFAMAQLPAGYVQVQPLRYAEPFARGSGGSCWNIHNGAYDEEKLKLLMAREECAEAVKNLDVDLNKHTLIGYSSSGDCHMELPTRIYRSKTDKKYLFIINNIYGGCRAAGRRYGWVVLDKIPDDYTLEMNQVSVDKVHYRDKTDEFKFPKQPTGIKPEMLELREIDAKDCLPLDRQSQWVFIKADYLREGLERFPDTAARCKEYFEGLNIDFKKYDLVGYNFNTGHCYRPQGIEQHVIKDYDDEVYRLEITYPKTTAYCHALRYFPIWVLVPKHPIGFRFEIVAKGRGEKDEEDQ